MILYYRVNTICLMMLIFLIWLAILLLPHSNELFLSLLAFLEIFRILGFLKRMPIVQDPIRGSDYTLMSYTSRTCGN